MLTKLSKFRMFKSIRFPRGWFVALIISRDKWPL